MFTENICKTLHCEVAVIGGGVAGCAAAIEASRKGMRTLLLEKGVSLGGLATNGYVPSVAGAAEGICLEFVQRLNDIGQVSEKTMAAGRNYTFEPEYGKLVLEDMVFEAGVRVLYDSTLIYVETQDVACDDKTCALPSSDKRIVRAIFYTKGGYLAVDAKVFIDTTGDGDVAALAGVPFEVGGQDFGGLNIATTLGNRWANVNLVKYTQAQQAYLAEQKAQGIENPRNFIMALEDEAIRKGELSRLVGSRSGFFYIHLPNTPQEDADIVSWAFHSYYCRTTDAVDITRQVLEQHQLIKQFHAFLRKYVPGFERVRLVGMGNIPGVRESRRIFGDYMLKAKDVACGTKFDDGIARFPEMFDTHHPTNEDWFFCRHAHVKQPHGSAVCEDGHIGQNCTAAMHPFGVPAGIPVRPDPRDYCEIPYRCLLPQGCINLLCAGRCCSAEFHANGAMRIIGPAMGTGMAAGLAASMAVAAGMSPRALEGTEVRRAMIEEEGVALDKPCEGAYWENMRRNQGTPVISGGDFIVLA